MIAGLGLAALAVAFAGLFWQTFANLAPIWWNDPSYGHSGAVAVAILGFIAHRAWQQPAGEPAKAQAALAFGLAGFAQFASTLFVSSWAAMLALFFFGRAVALLVGGRDYATRFVFPLLLVVFLFPLPYTWTSSIALLLQDVVSRLSETVLGLFVVCTRHGHSIRIAGMDQSLVIAEECSGLRQILAFVACAAVFGGLFRPRRVPHRLILVLAAVPVAIIANVLRVVLMNLAAYRFGTTWLGTWMHDVPSFFSLPVGIGLFFAADWYLFGLFGRPSTAKAPEPPARTKGLERRVLAAAGVTAIFAGANAALAWHLLSAPTGFTEFTAPVQSLPLQLGTAETAWQGRELTAEREKLIPKLDFPWQEMLLREYRHPTKPVGVQLYAVYSRTGDDRKHHPEICIREVAGAPEDVSRRAKIALAPDEPRFAQRFRFQTRAGQSIVVYYWHYRLPPDDTPRSGLQALNQLRASAAPSLTVQVSMAGESDLDLVETTLLPAVDRALRGIAPANTAVGCDRIPIPLARD